jgi:predicted porin
MEVVPRKRRPYSTLEKIEMKKTLVALAAFSAVAAFAQTTDGKPGIQITGLFSGGYQANSFKGVRVSGIDQNGSGTSSIHFRGLEDLGGGTTAYWHFENDFSFMNTNANAGVLPAYSFSNAIAQVPGTAVAGNINKSAEGKTGTFGVGELAAGIRTPMGDIAIGTINNAALSNIVSVVAPLQGTSFGGGYGTVIGADPTMTGVRWANSVRYIAPTIQGFTAQFIYAAKQNSTTGSVSSASGLAPTTTSLGVGLNNQLGAQELGLKYANGPLTVGFATSKTSLDSFCAAPTRTALVNAPTAADNPCYSATVLAAGAPIMNGQDNKQTGLAASYALPSGLLFSGAYQKTTLGSINGTTFGNQSDRVASLYQVMYTTGANTLFVNTGSVKENATGIISTAQAQVGKFFGAGYNYALSKNTALVARYESFQDNVNILGGLNASKDYAQTTAAAGNTTRIRSQVGMHMAF